MSLSALAIATRGFGYGSLQIAARGLLDVAVQSGTGGDEAEYVKGVEARAKWLRGEKVPSIYDVEAPEELESISALESPDPVVAATHYPAIKGAGLGGRKAIAPSARAIAPALNQPIVGADEMNEEMLLLMLMLAED